MSYGELWGKNFEALYLRAQMKFLIKIFFLHHAQHLNFDLKKDLGHSDRWKKTGTLKSLEPPPLSQVSQKPDSNVTKITYFV